MYIDIYIIEKFNNIYFRYTVIVKIKKLSMFTAN